MYNYTLPTPQPSVADVATCYQGATSITATGSTDYKWYKAFTGGTSFFTGPTYTTGPLLNDTTFYVSNAENSFESVRTPAKIIVKANPTISTSGSTLICSNESITLSVADADSYLWSTGATTKTIQVGTAGTYSVTVESTTPICQSTSDLITVSTNLAPVSDFTISGDLKSFTPVQFTDQSTDAIAWLWDFGNGATSTEQNPTVSFTSGQAFEVQLKVTSSDGCQDISIQTAEIITGLDETTAGLLEVYPNPFRSSVVVSLDAALLGPRSVQLLTIHGRLIFSAEGISTAHFEIPAADQPAGMYIVRVAFQDRVLNKKVVKIH